MKMKKNTHKEAKKAIQELDNFLPTEKVVEKEFESLPVKFDDLYEAGRSASDRAHTLGTDIDVLAKLWSHLNEEPSDEETGREIATLVFQVDSTVDDAKSFRNAATDLDVKTDETIGEVLVARNVLKKRIDADEGEKRRIQRKIKKARIELEKVNEGNWLDQLNNKITVDIPDPFGGSDPFGLDDGDNAERARIYKRIDGLEEDKDEQVAKKRRDEELVPLVDQELTVLQNLDADVATLENLAIKIKKDLEKARRDLAKEQKTSSISAAEFYKKRLGKDMEELLSWSDAFPPDAGADQRMPPVPAK